MHIADLRAISLTDNPWLDHPHAHTFAPLMVAGTHAYADIVEHLVDTSPAGEAYDLARGMLHSFEGSLPAPLDATPWPCQCDLVDAPHHDVSIRAHMENRAIERAFAAPSSLGDLPTAPIRIVAA